MLCQVKTLQRELDIEIYFLAIASAAEHAQVASGLATALLKPLEVDNEDGRGFVNFELLFGSDVLLALVAIPHVVLVQNLCFLELVEAVLNSDTISFTRLLIVGTSIDSLAFLLSRQMLHEILFEFFGKDHVYNEVRFASVVSVEADVVFDSNLVQHVENSHVRAVRKRATVPARLLAAKVAVLVRHAIALLVLYF